MPTTCGSSGKSLFGFFTVLVDSLRVGILAALALTEGMGSAIPLTGVVGVVVSAFLFTPFLTYKQRSLKTKLFLFPEAQRLCLHCSWNWKLFFILRLQVQNCVLCCNLIEYLNKLLRYSPLFTIGDINLAMPCWLYTDRKLGLNLNDNVPFQWYISHFEFYCLKKTIMGCLRDKYILIFPWASHNSYFKQ